jgi:hypothetical protein
MENLIRKSEAIEGFDVRKFVKKLLARDDEQKRSYDREDALVTVNIDSIYGLGAKEFYRLIGKKKTYTRTVVLDSRYRMGADGSTFDSFSFNVVDLFDGSDSTLQIFSPNSRILSIHILDILMGGLAQDQAYEGPDGFLIRPGREIVRNVLDYYGGYNRNTGRVGLLFEEYSQFATRGSGRATGVHFYANPTRPAKWFFVDFGRGGLVPSGDPVPLDPWPNSYGPFLPLSGTLAEVYPFHEGKFDFHEPPTLKPTLTATIKDPTDPHVFLPDRTTGVFTYGVRTYFTVTFPWNTATYPEFVFITDFTTSDPEGDKEVIDQINGRGEGWPTKYISDTQLEMDFPFPDTSGISGLSSPFTLHILSRQTIITAKFVFSIEDVGDENVNR